MENSIVDQLHLALKYSCLILVLSTSQTKFETVAECRSNTKQDVDVI